MKVHPLLGGLVFAACAFVSVGVQAAPVRKSAPARPVAVVPQNLEVELVHQLGEDKGEQLRKLVDRFNEQSKDGKVVLSNRLWGQGRLPHMTIVSESDEDLYLDGKPRYKPVWKVMKDAGIPFNASAPSKTMVPSALDATKRLVALPVALSTPVVFYNKELLEKVGVAAEDVPRTWRKWVDVLGRFHTEGVGCPMTVSQPVSTLFENAASWNNQPFTLQGKTEQFAGNGLMHVKHMAMMTSWRKAGYLYYFGRGTDAEQHFTSGECGVLLAPSGAYPSLVRDAGFTVAVAPYPYHEDAYGAPSNTLADGPSLWIGGDKTPAEYKLIARFIQFWLTPDSQVEWQVNAGYLPLNRAGVLAASGSTLLKDQFAATRQALLQLNNKPAAAQASAFTHRLGVRRILAEEIEQIFDDKKPTKQGLDDAVQRIRLAEDGCCRVRVQ